jgi:hypothetical protein
MPSSFTVTTGDNTHQRITTMAAMKKKKKAKKAAKK